MTDFDKARAAARDADALLDQAIEAYRSNRDASKADALHSKIVQARENCCDTQRDLLAALDAAPPAAMPVPWTEDRLREEAKARGWKMMEWHEPTPKGPWRYPFVVSIPSAELCALLVQPPAAQPAQGWILRTGHGIGLHVGGRPPVENVGWEPLTAADITDPVAPVSRGEATGRWFGDVMAVMHADGGHYQAKHGAEKAAIDAIEKYHGMWSRIRELEAKNAPALDQDTAGLDAAIHLAAIGDHASASKALLSWAESTHPNAPGWNRQGGVRDETPTARAEGG